MNTTFKTLLLVIIPLSLFSQKKITGKVIYNYSVEKFISSNKEIKNSKVNRLIKTYNEALTNNVDKIHFSLLFSKNKSFYFMNKIMNIDESLKYAIIFNSGKDNIFMNINNLKIIEREVFGEKFIIEDNYNPNWELKNENKKIGEYTCYKATYIKTSKDFSGKTLKTPITAWYTPDIPVTFGPKGYGNLPGLILELKEGKFKYYATQIKLFINVEIKKPTKGKKISMEKFNELIIGLNSRKK